MRRAPYKRISAYALSGRYAYQYFLYHNKNNILLIHTKQKYEDLFNVIESSQVKKNSFLSVTELIMYDSIDSPRTLRDGPTRPTVPN